MPSLTSGWPNLACSLAMRRWQAIASSPPPPSAKPFTAAITGFPHVSSRRSTAWPRSARALPSNGPCWARSPMSAPATKALGPAPVRIAPRISSPVARRSATSASSAITWSFSALSLSGRLMVINATPSLISKRRVWYSMRKSYHENAECGMRSAECECGPRFPVRPSNYTPHSALRISFLLMPVQAIAWTPSGAVRIVDQRALPEAHIERDLESVAAMVEAIRTLQVRGAPLIGIAAAMGLVAGLRDERGAPRERFLARVEELAAPLAAARPTAVNLRWALGRLPRVAAQAPGDGAAPWDRLESQATAIWEEDRAMCRRIGEAGLPLVPDGAAVLTHCNAGALATGGIGTALAPIYLAHEAGRRVHVYVDETRPVLQGARLTAWELAHAGIRCTVIADAAAGALMRQARVDLVLVGADRIAANGDFANKIGTYALAVLARHHGVPFYCAAPSSTIDPALADGDGIPIEQRGPEEGKTLAGRPVAPAAAAALNPAFDVTPARYVSGVVTDRGLEQPPFGDGGGRRGGAPPSPWWEAPRAPRRKPGGRPPSGGAVPGGAR